MNKLALLVAATGVLAGCQSFEPTQQGVRSVYSGDNSVLYQVRKQAGSANQAMLMADAAYRAGDLDQALYLYLRTLELEPKHYAALVAIGRIHRERGNLQLAEMALNEVLAATPDDIEALAELGLLRLEQRDLGQARTALERAVTLDQQRLGKALGAGALQPGELSVGRASPVRLYNAMGVLADLGSSFAEAEGYYRLALPSTCRPGIRRCYATSACCWRAAGATRKRSQSSSVAAAGPRRAMTWATSAWSRAGWTRPSSSFAARWSCRLRTTPRRRKTSSGSASCACCGKWNCSVTGWPPRRFTEPPDRCRPAAVRWAGGAGSA